MSPLAFMCSSSHITARMAGQTWNSELSDSALAALLPVDGVSLTHPCSHLESCGCKGEWLRRMLLRLRLPSRYGVHGFPPPLGFPSSAPLYHRVNITAGDECT